MFFPACRTVNALMHVGGPVDLDMLFIFVPVAHSHVATRPRNETKRPLDRGRFFAAVWRSSVLCPFPVWGRSEWIGYGPPCLPPCSFHSAGPQQKAYCGSMGHRLYIIRALHQSAQHSPRLYYQQPTVSRACPWPGTVYSFPANSLFLLQPLLFRQYLQFRVNTERIPDRRYCALPQH